MHEKWEEFYQFDSTGRRHPCPFACRLRVPGGWIYKVDGWDENSVSVSCCFVPYHEEGEK